jgi:hypothetical protein
VACLRRRALPSAGLIALFIFAIGPEIAWLSPRLGRGREIELRSTQGPHPKSGGVLRESTQRIAIAIESLSGLQGQVLPQRPRTNALILGQGVPREGGVVRPSLVALRPTIDGDHYH